ncbi:hypothetical protein GCM10010400_76690 [Streptomyces aculeolatus]|uniref:hypothetical protein n=1 Tax=Streptomyces aculeolatus TaxID=270689 RepID=UPI001CEDC185|nr:hypothetical protein [Streptomyces aculeolatus]
MRPDERSSAGIHDGQFHAPVQVGGSQFNLYKFSARRISILVAGLAMLGFLAWLSYHLYTSSESYHMRAEEELLRDLKPGKTYSKIDQELGSSGPDYTVTLDSGNKLHQYERKWEVIQVLEDKGGTALSIGVYAGTQKFHPSLEMGTFSVRLNDTTVDRVQERSGLPPEAANKYCAAHKIGYLESYTLPIADGGDIVVGSYADGNLSTGSSASICDIKVTKKSCYPPLDTDKVSKAYAECIAKSRNAQAIRNKLQLTFFIVAAPGREITRDMLKPPDFPG